ncbi:MAG: hypothetical protein HXY51_07285 [Nitrospirae bacterium]|nr:hypothetical protein [Nitrospirota bacterium]
MAELYSIFSRHYESVSFEQFSNDFYEKDFVVLLRDPIQQAVCGFSTVAIFEQVVCSQKIRLVYSGDTIIDPRYWGGQALVKAWCHLAGQIKALRREVPLYWLLISKGYRTYLYLPLFSYRFYPSHDCEVPSFEKEIIRDFGRFKFGSWFNELLGVVSFPESRGHLRAELADVPDRRVQNPHVAFFLRANPQYRNGDELVCITRLDEANMRSLARRYFLVGMKALDGHTSEQAPFSPNLDLIESFTT